VSAGLKAFQQRMAAAVMTPLTRRGTMARRQDGRPVATGWVRPSDRLDGFQRLEIYNRQYWYRLLSCLAEDFPGLRAILGGAGFDRMAQAYLVDCPSTCFTLRNLGARLADWLDGHPAAAGSRFGPALDMARLEWAHIEAYDRAALPPASAPGAALAAGTRFRLQPHLQLLALDHPVDTLLLAIRRDLRDRDEAGAGNRAMAARHARLARRALAPAPEPVHLAVHRQEHHVYYKRLDPEGFAILAGLRAGATLGEALEAGFRDSPMPAHLRPAHVARLFQDGAALGWFTDLRMEAP
jgi:hypothetical protein